MSWFTPTDTRIVSDQERFEQEVNAKIERFNQALEAARMSKSAKDASLAAFMQTMIIGRDGQSICTVAEWIARRA